MRVQLPERLVRRLTKLPESGMGFQLVDVGLANGVVVRGCAVYNAEQIDLPDDLALTRIVTCELVADSHPKRR